MNDRPQDEARYDPGTDEHRAGRPSPPVDGLEEPLARIETWAQTAENRYLLAAVGDVRAEVARLGEKHKADILAVQRVHFAVEAEHVETWRRANELLKARAERAEAVCVRLQDALRAVTVAVEEVQAFEDAGGDDWWGAHDKLYRASEAALPRGFLGE